MRSANVAQGLPESWVWLRGVGGQGPLPNGQAAFLVIVLLASSIGMGLGKIWNQSALGLLIGICTGAMLAHTLRIAVRVFRRR